MKKFAAAAMLLILFWPGLLLAEDVSLMWDPVIHPDLVGYKLHYGHVAGSYQVTVDVGNVTSYTIVGLDNAKPHFFVATAYSTADEESDYSNEVYALGIDKPSFNMRRK